MKKIVLGIGCMVLGWNVNAQININFDDYTYETMTDNTISRSGAWDDTPYSGVVSAGMFSWNVYCMKVALEKGETLVGYIGTPPQNAEQFDVSKWGLAVEMASGKTYSADEVYAYTADAAGEMRAFVRSMQTDERNMGYNFKVLRYKGAVQSVRYERRNGKTFQEDFADAMANTFMKSLYENDPKSFFAAYLYGVKVYITDETGAEIDVTRPETSDVVAHWKFDTEAETIAYISGLPDGEGDVWTMKYTEADSDAVKTVRIDEESNGEVYDITGAKVFEGRIADFDVRGVYIVKQGGRTAKFVR